MFYFRVNDRTELRLIISSHRDELFHVVHANRDHLRRWHPWVDILRSTFDVEKVIAAWQLQHVNNRGMFVGIWFDGNICGMINHQNVDWPNRWTALSYWLDAAHQGKGIMTECCRALVNHGFNTWNLNRVTIECATENLRSRRIPERLGFKLEGVVRGIERLPEGFVDHAMYGMLKSEFAAATVA